MRSLRTTSLSAYAAVPLPKLPELDPLFRKRMEHGVLDDEVYEEALQSARAELREVYDRARRVESAWRAGRSREAVHGLMALGHHYREQERWEAARECYRMVQELARWKGLLGIQLEATYKIGKASWRLEEYEAALQAYREGIELARTLEDRSAMCTCYEGIGGVELDRGNTAESADAYLKVLHWAQEGGNPALLAGAYHNLSIALRRRGDLERAIKYATQAIEGYEGLEDGEELAKAYNDRGTCYRVLERYQEAEGDYLKALRRSRQFHTKGRVVGNLALNQLAQGRLDEAENTARLAYETAGTVQDWLGVVEALMVRGAVARRRREWSGVFLFEEALNRSNGYAEPWTLSVLYGEYGLLRLAMGQEEEARPLLKQAADYGHRLEFPYPFLQEIEGALGEIGVTNNPQTKSEQAGGGYVG